MSDRTEQIKCHFCLANNSVFWANGPYLKCENCKAEFYLQKVNGKKFEPKNVIQDLSKLETDKLFGLISVFPVKGDVSRKEAMSIIKWRELKNGMGLTRLSDDFENLLWYNSQNAKFDHEMIRAAANNFAHGFTAVNDFERITQMTFYHNIVGAINYQELAQIHKVIDSIPKSNGNLIRYFIAEAQTGLIIKAVNQAYSKFRKIGNEYGAKIAHAMCI